MSENGAPAILFDETVVSTAPKDIAPQIATYFDEDAIREPLRKLYRHDSPAGRWYYDVGEDGTARVYPSVTTVIRATTPLSPFLLKWIADYGLRRAEQLRDERAAYGTLMHVVFGELLIAREIDLDAMEARVEDWRAEKRLPWDTTGWAEDLKQDLVGLADFMRDFSLKPLAIEVPLADDELGFAGCIDLVAQSTVTGQITLADFKSNRQTFYDDVIYQLGGYERLWNANFPDLPVDRLVAYGCKDWHEKSRGRYRSKDMTAEPKSRRFPTLLAIWKDDQGEKARRPLLTGKLSLESAPSIHFESLEESLARGRESRPRVEQEATS